MEEESRVTELKVSRDDGVTWQRRKVNMEDLSESGLHPGEMFQYQGERYLVGMRDGELGVEKVERPGVKKKPASRRK